MISASHIQRIIFRKKRLFSFLNVTGGLLLLAVLITTLICGYGTRNGLADNKKFFLNSTNCTDLTYIKPFTSLVEFNWKFRKTRKHTIKEVKPVTCDFFTAR